MMISSLSLSTTWLLLVSLASSAVHGASLHQSQPQIARRMIVHERRASVPKGYTTKGTADDDHLIHMRINLAMADRSGLEEAVNKASDPSSDSYGQWLSKEDVRYYAEPSRDAIHAVTTWLQSHDVDSKSTTLSGDWLKFQIPVGTANKMLNAKYSVYKHAKSGKTSVRTLEYSIPEDLQEHINAVHPTTSFYQPHSEGRGVITLSGHHSSWSPSSSIKSESEKSDIKTFFGSHSSSSEDKTKDGKGQDDKAKADYSNCNKTVTPECLQKLYGIPTDPVSPYTNSTIGVSAFGEQNANKADLVSFFKLFRKDLPSNLTFDEQLIDSGNNSQLLSDAGLEANLDIQYTVGIANGIPTTFIDVGEKTKDGDDGGFLDIINFLLTQKSPPLVFTTSYGAVGDESQLSKSLTFAMCDAFMKLTARGVTILYATGDGGVASSPDGDCDGEPFLAAWPTCPYTTLVGATGNIPEKGADLSAGGFSNYFGQPAWQQKAVDTYLDKIGTKLYDGLYNRTGRGYPDVSAQGEKLQVFLSGEVTEVGGTSASSPIFAAIVALLNDELLSNGKGPLGFMNPWIYANPDAFFDIKNGSNPGCGTDGFPALEGWDPVTGVGSPNYQAMRKALGLSY